MPGLASLRRKVRAGQRKSLFGGLVVEATIPTQKHRRKTARRRCTARGGKPAKAPIVRFRWRSNRRSYGAFRLSTSIGTYLTLLLSLAAYSGAAALWPPHVTATSRNADPDRAHRPRLDRGLCRCYEPQRVLRSDWHLDRHGSHRRRVDLPRAVHGVRGRVQ